MKKVNRFEEKGSSVLKKLIEFEEIHRKMKNFIDLKSVYELEFFSSNKQEEKNRKWKWKK